MTDVKAIRIARFCNIGTTAHVLDISRTELTRLEELGVLQRTGRKDDLPFDLVECVHNYIDHLKGLSEAEPIDHKGRLDRAKADKAEMEVINLRGQLLDRDSVVFVVNNAFTIVKTRLLGIPIKMAQILAVSDDPNVIREELSREIREALEELAAREILE